MGIKKIFRINKGTMKRSLGIIEVFSVGYGDLGSSIYYALGLTALYAMGATPIALMIAGFVFFLTALTYAEMSSIVPESGGSASFSRRAFNDLISFLAGWALLLDYIVTIAISSYAVGPYLKYFFPSLVTQSVNLPFTCFLILFLLIVNIFGTKHSARLSVFLSFSTIITQAFIIIFGFFTLVNFKVFFESLAIGSSTVPYSPSWGHFFKGVAMAMVAYTGIESMAQLGSETKQPAVKLPAAKMLVSAVLIVTYLGLSIVALSAMTPVELSTEFISNPILGITEKFPVIGPIFSNWVGILGGFILLAAANSGLLGASRVAFNLGEYCQLPRFFYTIHSRFKTPHVALTFFAILAILIVIWSFGSLAFLADLYNFGALLAFLSAHLSLIAHRICYPDAKRPFKIPFALKVKGVEIPWSAISGVILNFTIWMVIVLTKKEGRELGFLWLLVGFIFYSVLRRYHKIGLAETVEVQKVEIKDFEKLSIKKILVPIKVGHDEDNINIGCHFAKEMHASITFLYVSEVPYALPLSVGLKKKSKYAEAVFQRVEAIAKEYGIRIDHEFIASRSISKSIVEFAEEEDYDLIILGASEQYKFRKPISPVIEYVMKESNCKVWVCKKTQD